MPHHQHFCNHSIFTCFFEMVISRAFTLLEGFLSMCSPFNRASQVALVVKNSPDKARDSGDTGSILVSERSPGGGPGNPFQYSCLENPMDRGAWWAMVHRVTESQTWLKQLTLTDLFIVSLFLLPKFQIPESGWICLVWDRYLSVKGVIIYGNSWRDMNRHGLWEYSTQCFP